MQKNPQFSKRHRLLNEKQKKPFVLLNDQVTITHYSLTTASLAQVDKVLNQPELNLCCCDTGSIWSRQIFFSFCFFTSFKNQDMYIVFKNKLRIERDLGTDFLHRLLWCVNRSQIIGKYHSDRRKRDEMH